MLNANQIQQQANQIIHSGPYGPEKPYSLPLVGFFTSIGKFVDKYVFHPINITISKFFHLINPFNSHSSAFVLGLRLVITIIVLTVLIRLIYYLSRRYFMAQQIDKTLEKLDKATNQLNPDELIKKAKQAEANNDYKTALRLRFIAGLLTIERNGWAHDLLKKTNFEINETLKVKGFQKVSDDFNNIVYGNMKATINHIEVAKQTWPEIIKQCSKVHKTDARS